MALCIGDLLRTGLLLLLASHAIAHDSPDAGSPTHDLGREVRCPSSVNVSCRSMDLDDLQCQWVPSDEDDLQDTQMALFNFVNPLQPKFNCTCYSEWCDSCKGKCCVWKVPQYDYIHDEVVVELSTSTESCNVTYNHSLIVLPSAPDDVRVRQSLSYKQLFVTWENPVGFLSFDPGLFYSVDYRPKGVSEWQNITGHSNEYKGSVTLESLHGNVEYEVIVRIRSGARPPLDDNWWSPPTSSSNSTIPAAPETAPPVGVGSFEVEYSGSKQSVTLAWRSLPPLLHNGPDLQYQVLVKDDLNNILSNVTTKDTFIKISSLTKAESYSMEVKAVNRIGVSDETSVVRVPSHPPPVPQLLSVVAHSSQNAQYEARWLQQENLTYTLYVCTTGTSTPCQGNLYWVDVATASAVNVTLEDMNVTESGSQNEVRFALSAENFARESSGMTWDECSPPKPFNEHPSPPGVSFSNVTTHSVTVRWGDLDCESRASVVEEVQLLWCEAQGSSHGSSCDGIPKRNVTDWFVGEILLEDLLENTDYQVYVRLKHRSGYTDWSEPLSFTTQLQALEIWLIAIVVLVAVSATLVFLVFAVYSRREIKETLFNMRRKIVLPGGLDDHQVTQDFRHRDRTDTANSRSTLSKQRIQHSSSLTRVDQALLDSDLRGERGPPQVEGEDPRAGRYGEKSESQDEPPSVKNNARGSLTRQGASRHGTPEAESSSGYSSIGDFMGLSSNSAGYEGQEEKTSDYKMPESFMGIPSNLPGHEVQGESPSPGYTTPESFMGMPAISSGQGGQEERPSPGYSTTISFMGMLSSSFGHGGQEGRPPGNHTSGSIMGIPAIPSDQEVQGERPSPGYTAPESFMGISAIPPIHEGQKERPTPGYSTPESFMRIPAIPSGHEVQGERPSPGYTAHESFMGIPANPPSHEGQKERPSPGYATPESFMGIPATPPSHEGQKERPSPGYSTPESFMGIPATPPSHEGQEERPSPGYSTPESFMGIPSIPPRHEGQRERPSPEYSTPESFMGMISKPSGHHSKKDGPSSGYTSIESSMRMASSSFTPDRQEQTLSGGYHTPESFMGMQARSSGHEDQVERASPGYTTMESFMGIPSKPTGHESQEDRPSPGYHTTESFMKMLSDPSGDEGEEDGPSPGYHTIESFMTMPSEPPGHEGPDIRPCPGYVAIEAFGVTSTPSGPGRQDDRPSQGYTTVESFMGVSSNSAGHEGQEERPSRGYHTMESFMNIASNQTGHENHEENSFKGKLPKESQPARPSPGYIAMETFMGKP